MRYLTIYTDALLNEKEAALSGLPFPDNHVALSVWLRLRLIVGSQVRGENRDLAFSLAQWSAQLALSEENVKKFFQILMKLELIEVFDDTDDFHRVRVSIPSLLFYADEWSRRKAKEKEKDTSVPNSGVKLKNSGAKLKSSTSQAKRKRKAKGRNGPGGRGTRAARAALRPAPSAGLGLGAAPPARPFCMGCNLSPTGEYHGRAYCDECLNRRRLGESIVA